MAGRQSLISFGDLGTRQSVTQGFLLYLCLQDNGGTSGPFFFELWFLKPRLAPG